MSSSPYEVRWHSTASGIATALWQDCFPPPLEGQWWYETLERSGLESQFTFFYAVVSYNDKQVAIAPAFVMDVPISQVVPPRLLPIFNALGKMIPSLLYQRTFFVGSPCADEGTVGMLPGSDRAAILAYLQPAFTAKARELRAPMFAWKDFPKSYDTELLRIAKSSGLFRLTSFPGTQVQLPSAGKEAYFSRLKGSYRHQLKKKLRRSKVRVEIDTTVMQNPGEDTLDEIFRLFWQTYEKSKIKFETLNRAFFTHIAAQPFSHFIIVRERKSGTMLAFMLCFAFPDEVINKFIGIDYQRPKEWFLYFRLWEAALDWSLARKANSIQSGQTGYKPKLETGHQLIALTHYCRHSNPVIHCIYRIFAKTVSWQTLDSALGVYLKAHPESVHEHSIQSFRLLCRSDTPDHVAHIVCDK